MVYNTFAYKLPAFWNNSSMSAQHQSGDQLIVFRQTKVIHLSSVQSIWQTFPRTTYCITLYTKYFETINYSPHFSTLQHKYGIIVVTVSTIGLLFTYLEKQRDITSSCVTELVLKKILGLRVDWPCNMWHGALQIMAQRSTFLASRAWQKTPVRYVLILCRGLHVQGLLCFAYLYF